ATNNIVGDAGDRVIVECSELRDVCDRIDPAEANGCTGWSGIDRYVADIIAGDGVRARRAEVQDANYRRSVGRARGRRDHDWRRTIEATDGIADCVANVKSAVISSQGNGGKA